MSTLTMLACAPAAPVRPNLVLIVIDTLRADRTSPYGHAEEVTPNLAQLADEAVRVEAAYAPTATTGPTHAGLFTGRFPRSVGVLRNAVPLAGEFETLAERLSAAGWETAAVVSSFPLHRRFGFAQGFAHYDDDFDPARATVRHTRFEGHAVPEGFDRRADEATDRALAWLGARDEAAPFFLFVHYFDPHEPYVAPRPYQQRFAAPPDATLRERARALYDAEVAFTDAEVGRLLAGLGERGLADSTYVVLTADHGEGLFDHGHLFHDVYLYEEAVRVPLLVRGPDLPRGAVLSGPVVLLDLLPTLLELLDVPVQAAAPDAGLVGVSLAAALRGAAPIDPEREIVLERREFTSNRVGTIRVEGEQLGVRRGAWKYIESPGEARRELYDLARDPREGEDVLEAHRELGDELAGVLARWRAAHPTRAAAGEVSEEDRARLEALGYTH